jgi:hypothetical protein
MFSIKISDTEEHEFDFGNPDNQELITLEKLFDGTFGEWLDALGKRSVRAMTALVCMLRRRSNPLLKVGDIHFKLSDFRIVNLDPPPDGEGEDPAEGSDANPTDTPSLTE